MSLIPRNLKVMLGTMDTKAKFVAWYQLIPVL